MQSLRSSILSYLRVRASLPQQFLPHDAKGIKGFGAQLYACSTTSGTKHDQVTDRVINLVKKFDKLDSTKVTEKAGFEKDLSLDSLDRVELVMAFEEEFSIEIPDEEADRLKCCSDVAKYIESRADKKLPENS